MRPEKIRIGSILDMERFVESIATLNHSMKSHELSYRKIKRDNRYDEFLILHKKEIETPDRKPEKS